MAFFKVNGAFFEGEIGNLQAVSDFTILQRLSSGQLSAKSLSSSEAFPKATEETRTHETRTEPEQTSGDFDASDLLNSSEYKALSSDDQEAVRAVFDAIASNDKQQAARLLQGFETAAKLADPYFAQQLRIAKDAIERGYVSIDQQEEFELQQRANRLDDLRDDITNNRDFLTAEQQSQLRGIERQYQQDVRNLSQSLAERGFTSSSRAIEQRELLDEATGDLRESTERRFGQQQRQLSTTLQRGERDIQAETERLKQLAAENKLSFLRQGEEQVGTQNLPRLSGAPSPLGGIFGQIPTQRQQDIISSAQSFIF